jgi:biopolymer transport protein TolR
MVTAPMLTSGVNVDLPKTDSKPINIDSAPLTVTITADGKVHFQDEDIALPDLVARLQAISQNDLSRRIFVRGDQAIAYGQVMQVMSTIAQGGFTKVALLAQQTSGAAPAR